MFHFGGGFPGGGGGGRGRQSSGPVDTTKLYKDLEVEKGATAAGIKKAYRKMAMKHHPDKGGDPEKFKTINKAYEILSDKDKRELYDEGGEEAVENGGAGGGDMFNDLFGGGRRGGGRRGKRKGEDVVFPLKVTLNDLYTATSKKLRLTKNVICADCSGKGGTGVEVCKDCKGQGVRLILRQLGPGMIQQMRAACTKCSGSGKSIAEANKCRKCHANKTVKEKKTLEVYVNKGMSHGQRIVFSGEADEAPDTLPGDVCVVLQQLEHSVFKRDGKHLFMKKSITLREALTGFRFTIEHLDKRILVVQSTPGKIYKPGDFKAIREEGMPQHKNPHATGNLYIELEIEFPTNGSIDAKTRQVLTALLPAPSKGPTPPASAEVEECELVDVDMERERRRFKEQRANAAESDDDDDEMRGRGGGGGQCQSQ